MYIIPVQNLACPIDGEELGLMDNQLVCTTGHSFDIARQGYVNLLPVQHKRSKNPGDSKEMVTARAEFLNSGFYEPLANKLAELVTEMIASNERQSCVLDAGCGEGYYLESILNSVEKYPSTNQSSFIGLDISKPAIIVASKRNKKINWIVGTNRQPPVLPESVDIILCVFGFQSYGGFHAALKLNGRIVLVEPKADHLKELREIIYSDTKETESADSTQLEELGFAIEQSESLTFKTGAINNEQINNLLMMTPHFFRANKEGREMASKLEKLDLTVDVVIRVLKKTA